MGEAAYSIGYDVGKLSFTATRDLSTEKDTMIKKLLIAAVFLIASPTVVFSQDFFLSFDPDSLLATDTQDSGSSSAYLFSDGLFGFDALDLDFFASDSSVIRFSGGEVFNPTFDTVGGTRFFDPQITVDTTTNTGNLFLVNLLENGVNPALGQMFDPGFNADVGPNGGFLLARLDFDIGGSGTSDIELALGDQGGLRLPNQVLNPSLGNASLTNSGLGPSVVFPPLPPVEPPVTPPVDPPITPPVDPPVTPPVDPPVPPPVDPPVTPPLNPPENPTSAELFVSFDSDSQLIGESGTAFIYSDGAFGFDALDLNFTTSDSSVLLLTGGVSFNDQVSTIGGTAFDSSVVTVDADGTSGNLFAVNVTENGINPAISELFNPHFESEVGPDGAVLLAAITYDLVGPGTAGIELSLGSQGIFQLPGSVLNPSLGSSSLTVERFANIPEPSSAVVILLGAAGMIIQRRRSLSL